MSNSIAHMACWMTDSFREPLSLIWVRVAFVIRSLQGISLLERAVALSGINPGIRITPTIIPDRPVSMVVFSRCVLLFALE